MAYFYISQTSPDVSVSLPTHPIPASEPSYTSWWTAPLTTSHLTDVTIRSPRAHFHTSERNYFSASKKEMLAVVFALKRFHYFVWGRHFTLFSDHKALSFLFSQRDPSPLMVNWIDVILSYDFEIIHRPGVLNGLPETLSRLFPLNSAFLRGDSAPKLMLLTRLLCRQRTVKPPWRMCISMDILAEGDIGKRLHAEGTTWPSMRQDIEKYLRRCIPCQRYTIVRQGYHPLTPITASQPMDHLALDTALSFPTFRVWEQHSSIMICVHTRSCLLRALADKSAISVSQALFMVFCDFGFPRVIQSDDGSEFVNQLVQLMTKKVGIDHRLTTKYHPRANGLAERTVQTACRAIRKLLESEDRQWDRYVPAVQLFMNAKVATIHGSATFSVMFGRRLNPFSDYTSDNISSPDVDFDRIKDRLLWFSDVLFPAIAERESGAASRAILSFAKTRRVLKEPFPEVLLSWLLTPHVPIRIDPITRVLSKCSVAPKGVVISYWILIKRYFVVMSHHLN